MAFHTAPYHLMYVKMSVYRASSVTDSKSKRVISRQCPYSSIMQCGKSRQCLFNILVDYQVGSMNVLRTIINTKSCFSGFLLYEHYWTWPWRITRSYYVIPIHFHYLL